ncbi:M20/M25/M40 family metallo-hydrolase [Cupriavidus basilensis]
MTTQRLVAHDTTSRHLQPRTDRVRAGPLPWRLAAPAELQPAARQGQPVRNTVPAASGETNGGIVLSGHTDVVPVDGQHSGPRTRSSRWCATANSTGRGTCDMKGFIGTSLALPPTLLDAKLREPVHYALSFDEEIGCMGAPTCSPNCSERGVRPAGCIVGEPTSMRVIVAHKGINAYRCCVRGHAAHFR